MIGLLLIIGFSVGEQLEYDARFSFINLGTMTLAVKDTLTHDGVPCYHIGSVLESASGLRFMFSIDDTIEVFTSRDSLIPYVYRERINESGYERASDIVFNHDSLWVLYDGSLKVDMEEGTRDLLSFWYYLRTVPMEPGDTIVLHVHSAKENHEIRCVVQRRERVKVRAGEFETLKVSPQTEGKGIFGAKGGMDIWYSEPDRLPVQIRASMKVGSVLFKLREVRN